MEKHVLKASRRDAVGKLAVRRLRREGLVPGNIYGHSEPNLNISLEATAVESFLDAGHRVVTVDVDGKEETSVVKEVQYDGLGSHIVHVDFARVSRFEKIELEVPIDLFGNVANGVVDFPKKEVLVYALASDLPERIEVRISDLKIGDIVRLKDLPVPPRCEFLDEPDAVILSVTEPKEEVVAGEAAVVEPEVIGKVKDEEDDKK